MFIKIYQDKRPSNVSWRWSKARRDTCVSSANNHNYWDKPWDEQKNIIKSIIKEQYEDCEEFKDCSIEDTRKMLSKQRNEILKKYNANKKYNNRLAHDSDNDDEDIKKRDEYYDFDDHEIETMSQLKAQHIHYEIQQIDSNISMFIGIIFVF